MGKKNIQMDILLAQFQTICIAWMGCGAIQFLSMTVDSKHHNLTFHSGCNVISSIHKLNNSLNMIIIHSHSFIPQNPKSHFPFFLILVSIETQSNTGKARVQKETQSNEALHFFLFYNIVSPSLCVWSCLPCIPPHCPTFFSSCFLI